MNTTNILEIFNSYSKVNLTSKYPTDDLERLIEMAAYPIKNKDIIKREVGSLPKIYDIQKVAFHALIKVIDEM